MDSHSRHDLCNRPIEVVTEGGAVVIVGPDGLALAMTPDAAARSGEILRAAAAVARGAPAAD